MNCTCVTGPWWSVVPPPPCPVHSPPAFPLYVNDFPPPIYWGPFPVIYRTTTSNRITFS